jgi:phospholipase/carboxylesterase
VDPSRVYLLGFSMGTVMAYALSLTRPELFRGVIANSGYVPEGTHLSFRWQELANLGYFIAHGTEDPVIPIDFAHRAQKLFAGSNAHVEYREYPMGHQISEESLHDSTAFLAGLLKI